MILSVDGIHKSYGKQKVLNGISFQIKEPKIVALVGPNGSGKSTLLNIITNLIEADKGEVNILHKCNKNPNIFHEISYMQDNTVLYDYLTGYDHLQFIGDIQGVSKQQILSTAKRIGMEGYLDKRVSKYSLGMKQHLLLTMAILNDPKLLIIDEPLNGLDPTSAIRVRNLFIELHKEGRTILLSSHNLSEIDHVTSNILFLKDGKLMEEDLSDYQNICYEISVDYPEIAKDILEEMGVQIDKMVENKLTVFIKDYSVQDVFLKLIEKQVHILDFNKKLIGSEDYYQMIFGREDMER